MHRSPDGTMLVNLDDEPAAVRHVSDQFWATKSSASDRHHHDEKKSDANKALKTHRKVIKDFIGSTTAHGLPRIFEDRHFILTLFWGIIFFTAMSVSMWQGYRLIKQYLLRDVTVRIEVVTAPSLMFPSVSICNTNKLRKSAVADSPHRELLAVDTEIVRPYFASDCLEGDFRCMNSGCIKSYLRCDGYDNCRDRSDEMGCTYGNCSNGKMKCMSGSDMGVCIDLEYRCDRVVDCYDGEDENQCVCKDKKEFQCTTSGRCVDISDLCDGNYDCPDSSDEMNCNDSGMYCAEDYFKCDNDRNCIPPSWKCDGANDCFDQTDEHDCGTVVPGDTGGAQGCSSSEYLCDAIRLCIPVAWMCDGEEDCATGSDESSCDGGWGSFCATGEFECDFLDCYSNSIICDGEVQCDDGTDEDSAICGKYDDTGTSPGDSDVFICDDGMIYPLSYQCDGFPDCLFSEDENCEGTDHFTCEDDPWSMFPAVKCDGMADCLDGSDEIGCDDTTDILLSYPEITTEAPTFLCSADKVELEWSQRCNKVVDCVDASDEIDCPRGRNASYTPDPQKLLERFSHLSGDISLFEDFVENYYDDHLFGRVLSEDPPDWYGFIAYSKTADYSDLEGVLKLKQEEVETLGHQIEDFILECQFDGNECDLQRDFRVYQDEKYGNCFQFNYADTEKLVTTKAGVNYGLKMTLYTEQNEYISTYGRDSGARVVIKTPGVPSIPSSEGFTILPGMISSVGIRENRIKRQPKPYGDCREESSYESLFGNKYSETACEETCIQMKMLEYCGCVNTMMMEETRCMLLNRTQDVCKQLMHYLMNKNKLGCTCKQSCQDSWFETVISQSLWPSKTFLKHLLKQIHFRNNKTRIINDFAAVSENLIRLEVFFDELNYESITEIPAYTEESLLSDIGGTLGLYCGFSFITMVEFLQFFADLLYLTYTKYILRRLHPVDHPVT
ncbi:uncharacterized protein [Ptychodera flava]|uniref:uncharacterized protein n=1 Tax=Ptychodera flava TaxID=63121 RepID=UPI00396A8EC5